MTQRLQNLTIASPAFFGLNTEESPVGMNPSYASIADNCVIDKRGRIGARKGHTVVSTNGAAVLGSSRGVEAVFEFTKFDGTVVVFSALNNNIYYGTSTLVACALPSGYTITANNWKIVSFNNDVYFFQTGYHPLVSVAGSTTLVKVVNPDDSHNAPFGNEVLAAFGRLWVADVSGNNYTVYWSQLLDGDSFSGGDSGSLDLTKVWPTGYDEIVSLAEHNGFLIIFGKRSIVIYKGAEAITTAAAFSLHDTIEGVGCIERDSVQATGNDMLFLSSTGVVSLGRIIQEKSLPLRSVSKNVRTDLMDLIDLEVLPVKSTYSASDAFYLITFPTSNITYCFDVRVPLEDGSFRATTWSGFIPLCFGQLSAGGFYMGLSTGIVKYAGYLDIAATYTMSYFSNPLDFGNPTILKFLKKFNLTVIGGQATRAVLNWGYDYTENYSKQVFTFGVGAATAQFNVTEFGTKETTAVSGGSPPDVNYVETEFSGGITINTPKVNTTGSGNVVTIGVIAIINNTAFSIQKIDILAKIGRLL